MKQNYVLLKTKGGKVNDIYAKLQDMESVEDAAITLGEHDIVAKLNLESEEELYNFYKEFNSLDGVEVVNILPSFIDKTSGADIEDLGYEAWILVRAKGDIDVLLDKLLKINGMAEAAAITGEWGILAHAYNDEIEEIGRIALKAQAIEGVDTTETLLAFPENFARA